MISERASTAPHSPSWKCRRTVRQARQSMVRRNKCVGKVGGWLLLIGGVGVKGGGESSVSVSSKSFRDRWSGLIMKPLSNDPALISSFAIFGIAATQIMNLSSVSSIIEIIRAGCTLCYPSFPFSVSIVAPSTGIVYSIASNQLLVGVSYAEARYAHAHLRTFPLDSIFSHCPWAGNILHGPGENVSSGAIGKARSKRYCNSADCSAPRHVTWRLLGAFPRR
jgi:hypothetical protein